ncbi:hypothetical protein BJX76DRAFT_122368 [Aspergillus varians]
MVNKGRCGKYKNLKRQEARPAQKELDEASMPPIDDISSYEDDKLPQAIAEDACETVAPAEPEEFDSANMPTTDGLIICEYDQPTRSPYEDKPATIRIGGSGRLYTAPMNILNQVSHLQERREEDECDPTTFRLSEVDDDIGHTFIHYLYTGDYQTLKPPTTCNLPRRAVEYSRSILAYHAALTYSLDGLADHARKYIQIFDKDIPIFEIIALARKTFPRITKDAWYSEYLTTKIMASFETEEGIFQQDEFFKGFGAAPDFDKFLGKIMANAYAQKLSSIRNASASTVPGSPKEQYPYAESLIDRIQGPSRERAASVDHEAWTEWEEDRRSETLLTPSSSSGETTEKESAHQLDSDLSYGGCSYWQAHCTDQNLWKNCPRCKSHVLNMFTELMLK